MPTLNDRWRLEVWPLGLEHWDDVRLYNERKKAMCDDSKQTNRVDADQTKEDYERFVRSATSEANAAAGAGMGRALGATEPNYSAGFAYSPNFVKLMLDIYSSERAREEFLSYSGMKGIPREQLDLLEKAGIVQSIQVWTGHHGITRRVIDDAALKAYVHAVCNVPLPIKTWQIPNSLGLRR